jgi:hypothetical protein
LGTPVIARMFKGFLDDRTRAGGEVITRLLKWKAYFTGIHIYAPFFNLAVQFIFT